MMIVMKVMAAFKQEGFMTKQKIVASLVLLGLIVMQVACGSVSDACIDCDGDETEYTEYTELGVLSVPGEGSLDYKSIISFVVLENVVMDNLSYVNKSIDRINDADEPYELNSNDIITTSPDCVSGGYTLSGEYTNISSVYDDSEYSTSLDEECGTTVPSTLLSETVEANQGYILDSCVVDTSEKMPGDWGIGDCIDFADGDLNVTLSSGEFSGILTSVRIETDSSLVITYDVASDGPVVAEFFGTTYEYEFSLQLTWTGTYSGNSSQYSGRADTVTGEISVNGILYDASEIFNAIDEKNYDMDPVCSEL